MDAIEDPAAWRRLGTAVRRRREDLLLSQAEAVRRADGLISLPTWSLIENAHRDTYRRRTLQGVARALEWPPDGCHRILDGADAETLGRLRSDEDPGDATAPVELPVDLARRFRAADADDRRRVHAVIDALLPPLPR